MRSKSVHTRTIYYINSADALPVLLKINFQTMIKVVKTAIFVTLFALVYGDSQAQQKKVVKKTIIKPAPKDKFIPREYGAPASVADVTDVTETSAEYESLKNLIEISGVTITYADNTFKPAEPLRRGDFVVSFNSALEAVKKAADSGGLDSSLINTYDKNQSYITSAAEIKDVTESSVYYPAVQSLIEKWGIAAPFTKTRLLDAGAPMSESEVYDILRVTLGYNSSGANPYASAITRSKFATVLNNALNLKLSQVNSLATARADSLSDLRMQQEAMLKQQDKMRRDSLAREVELSKMEAQRKEGEAWKKLSDKEKRKQLKSQEAIRN